MLLLPLGLSFPEPLQRLKGSWYREAGQDAAVHHSQAIREARFAHGKMRIILLSHERSLVSFIALS